MGSYPETVNLLKHLRSKSQVDCDSLDLQRKLLVGPSRLKLFETDTGGISIVATELGPFVDCTSNQVRVQNLKSREFPVS